VTVESFSAPSFNPRLQALANKKGENMSEAKKKLEIKKDIALLLIGLTCWEEEKRNEPGIKVLRAWKGYTFDILNDLEQEKYIHQIPGGKSLFLTDEGKKRVEQLKQRHLKSRADKETSSS
jgi:hypothetical protein